MSAPPALTIRPEQPGDEPGIRLVTSEAFGQNDEADLVDALREAEALAESVVAIADGKIVGHAALSYATIEDKPILALAPVSVAPSQQGRGIGAKLVRDILAKAGEAPVTVLGDPDYYRQFGFEPSRPHGIVDPFTDDPDAPQILRVDLAGPGTIEYHSAFFDLS